MTSVGWRLGILCSRTQINIDILLNCGQSFRWKKKDDTEWIGVIGNHVWQLRQTENGIIYKVYGQQMINKKMEKRIGFTEASLKCESKISKNGNDNTLDIVSSPDSLYIKKEKNDSPSIPESGVEKETSHGKRRNQRSENRPMIGKMPKEVGKQCESNIGLIDCSKTASLDNFGAACVDNSNTVNSIEQVKSETITKNYNMNKFGLPSILLSQGILKETDIKQIYLKEGIDELKKCDQFPFPLCEDCERVLGDYFQVNVDLGELYDYWSSRDSHFKQVAGSFTGIRILRQDPTENLLSFVCSSNNHISRISGMVEKLCVHYGKCIAQVDGEKYFSFPKLSDLTGNEVEGHLRQLGFGYRAKFIAAIARSMTDEGKGDAWLESLRECSYKETKAELMKLMGVGAKVADCVCLMSLDKPQAVPVDTHVWQITVKNYMAELQIAKSLTDRIYNQIGDFYRDLWGPYAGWAHSVLFTADLKQNKDKNSTSTKKRSSQEQQCSIDGDCPSKAKKMLKHKEQKKRKAR